MATKLLKYFWILFFALSSSSWSMESKERLSLQENNGSLNQSYQFLSFENVPELYPDFFYSCSLETQHITSLVCKRWHAIVSHKTLRLQLRSPWVVDYDLGAISNLVKRFTNIRTLIARYNDQLEDEHLQCLSHLTTLDMSLKEYIGGCGINTMAITDHGVMNLTNLTSLNLCGHEGITNRAIQHLTNLKQLNISGENNGCYKDNYTSQINHEGISKLTNLTKLSLKNNNVVFPHGCLILPMLTSLSLSYNMAMDDVSLQKMTGLTELNISSNDMISDNCLSQLVHLKVLNISWNDLITNIGITPLTALTELNLRYNRQITHDCLENFPCLRILRLHMNSQITDKSLLKLSTLTSLDLSGCPNDPNYLTTGGISDWSVSQLISLTCLNLDYNLRISNKGIYGLTNLQKLGLSHCSKLITEEAVNSLINLTALNVEWERTLNIEKFNHLTKLRWLNVSWPIKYSISLIRFKQLFNEQIEVRSYSYTSHQFFKEIDKKIASTTVAMTTIL